MENAETMAGPFISFAQSSYNIFNSKDIFKTLKPKTKIDIFIKSNTYIFFESNIF